MYCHGPRVKKCYETKYRRTIAGNLNSATRNWENQYHGYVHYKTSLTPRHQRNEQANSTTYRNWNNLNYGFVLYNQFNLKAYEE